jgi:hypothetical protein
VKANPIHRLCAMATIALACGGTPVDGSASESQADSTASFVGTWPGSFNMSENCPTTLPTTSSGADMLVITPGEAEAGPGIISVLTKDGCTFDYAVDGVTATALPNQMCLATHDGLTTASLHVSSRTLTLSGGELDETGSVTVTRNGVPCSDTEQGTYAR